MPTPKKKVQAKPVQAKPVKESKSDMFTRVARPRVEKVLKSLRILGNCSNRSIYEYNQEQIDKMFNTINEAMLSTEQKFTKNKTEAEKFEF